MMDKNVLSKLTKAELDTIGKRILKDFAENFPSWINSQRLQYTTLAESFQNVAEEFKQIAWAQEVSGSTWMQGLVNHIQMRQQLLALLLIFVEKPNFRVQPSLVRVRGCMCIGRWIIDWNADNGKTMLVVCEHLASRTVYRLTTRARLTLLRFYELRVRIIAKLIRRSWWSCFI